MMESFIEKDGKKLRRGYTTGACAAAAAKSAALMLFSGEPIASVHLLTPGGIALDLAVRNAEVFETAASCGIVKDSGDDPDVTDGMMIRARVCKTDRPH
ncbi:MAG: cobalt-precorrin-5B (C(1))-methyltransferase, partial [Clostridia bacterium]|nr:cobalt-precorrin-5B (C(1))-methyltransferase [Clostridia bacterium]